MISSVNVLFLRSPHFKNAFIWEEREIILFLLLCYTWWVYRLPVTLQDVEPSSIISQFHRLYRCSTAFFIMAKMLINISCLNKLAYFSLYRHIVGMYTYSMVCEWEFRYRKHYVRISGKLGWFWYRKRTRHISISMDKIRQGTRNRKSTNLIQWDKILRKSEHILLRIQQASLTSPRNYSETFDWKGYRRNLNIIAVIWTDE